MSLFDYPFWLYVGSCGVGLGAVAIGTGACVQSPAWNHAVKMSSSPRPKAWH